MKILPTESKSETKMGSDTAKVVVVEELARATRPDADLEKVVLDKDLSWTKTMGLTSKREHCGVWLYYMILPILFLLIFWSMMRYFVYLMVIRPKDLKRRLLGPERNLLVFDRAHWLLEKTRNGVMSWTALAAIYSSLLVLRTERGWRKWIGLFWFSQPEAQAVRNRVLEVMDATYHHLHSLWFNGVRDLKIVSLASGSAQATLDAVALFIEHVPEARPYIHLTLVDLNEFSLELAKKVADNNHIADLVEVRHESISDFTDRPENQGQFVVVEMAGFLDYRPDRKFVEACSGAASLLAPYGLIILAQIGPSHWALVTRWITGWPRLIRRDATEFRRLLEVSDLVKTQIQINSDPWRIYHIAFCRRNG